MHIGQAAALIEVVDRAIDNEVIRSEAGRAARTSGAGRISPGPAVRSDSPDPRRSPGRPRPGRLPPTLCPRRW